MDIAKEFDDYMAYLGQGLGHADRHAGLSGYCTGLMLPLSRKSVEPMAARVDPLHARIKAFLGTSENAVKTQIWIAVCTYVLIAIAKKRLHLEHHSLYEILQILSLTMFETSPINQLLTPPSTDPEPDFESNQLVLL